MKVAIFSRVSTDGQNIDRQTSELMELCTANGWTVAEIITEQISGAKSIAEREGLQRLLELAKCRKIDKVIVSEVSRLGRNVTEGLKVLEALTAAGISLYIKNIATETLLNDGRENFMFKPILLTLIGFAEMERALLKERIKSGINNARRKGHQIGRPKGKTETADQILSKYPQIVRKVKQGYSVREAAKLCDVSVNTVQKVKTALLSRCEA